MTDHDNTMTATQKREAIKIAKRKVTLAQEGLITEFTERALDGEPVTKSAQAAYNRYKALMSKEEAAKALVATARKEWYAEMGRNEERGRYNNDAGVSVRNGKVFLLPADARSIEAASMRRHPRKTKPSVDEVIETLRRYRTAAPLVGKLEALQEFIEIELPTDMWLSTTDAYKALHDIDAMIAGIITD